MDKKNTPDQIHDDNMPIRILFADHHRIFMVLRAEGKERCSDRG